jgi:hypothetical protein
MDTIQVERSYERYAVEVCSVVKHPSSFRRIDAELWDLSAGGCRIVTPEPLNPNDQLLVRIEGLESWPARVVWKGANAVGVTFQYPLHYAVVEHYARLFPATEGREEA